MNKKAICLMDERKDFAIKNLTNKLITKVSEISPVLISNLNTYYANIVNLFLVSSPIFK